MKVIKVKMSHHFFSRILRDEIELGDSELPSDVKVAAVKGDYQDEWFWVYLTSKEFIDIDKEFDTIPEMTLWYGGRKKK